MTTCRAAEILSRPELPPDVLNHRTPLLCGPLASVGIPAAIRFHERRRLKSRLAMSALKLGLAIVMLVRPA